MAPTQQDDISNDNASLGTEATVQQSDEGGDTLRLDASQHKDAEDTTIPQPHVMEKEIVVTDANAETQLERQIVVYHRHRKGSDTTFHMPL